MKYVTARPPTTHIMGNPPGMDQRRGTRSRLRDTQALGQSIWYDNIRRGLLRSGELAGLIDAGVRGLTSNPTIFEKAIVSSTDYEEALRALVAQGHPATAVYEELVVEDIQGACKLLAPVF